MWGTSWNQISILNFLRIKFFFLGYVGKGFPVSSLAQKLLNLPEAGVLDFPAHIRKNLFLCCGTDKGDDAKDVCHGNTLFS